jgi:hypothetical protein
MRGNLNHSNLDSYTRKYLICAHLLPVCHLIPQNLKRRAMKNSFDNVIYFTYY